MSIVSNHVGRSGPIMSNFDMVDPSGMNKPPDDYMHHGRRRDQPSASSGGHGMRQMEPDNISTSSKHGQSRHDAENIPRDDRPESGRRRTSRTTPEDFNGDSRRDYSSRMTRQRSTDSGESSSRSRRREASDSSPYSSRDMSGHPDPRQREKYGDPSVRRSSSRQRLEDTNIAPMTDNTMRDHQRSGESQSSRRVSRDRRDQRGENRERRSHSRSRNEERSDVEEGQYRRRNDGGGNRDQGEMVRERRRSQNIQERDMQDYQRERRSARSSREDTECPRNVNNESRASGDHARYSRSNGGSEGRERRTSYSTVPKTGEGNEEDGASIVSSRSAVSSRHRSGSRQSLICNDDDSLSYRSRGERANRSPRYDKIPGKDMPQSNRRRSRTTTDDERGYTNEGLLEPEPRKNGRHMNQESRNLHPDQINSEATSPRVSSGRSTNYLRSDHEKNGRYATLPTNNRRTSSPKDDGHDNNNIALSHNKNDNLSRRSSSSRSNHDTGFASSSSSPRRDDSQSRFSDISPGRYGEDIEATRGHAPETGIRRRSKMVSNTSLDVPGHQMRKEQSLSSSGRGDSSFEETHTENTGARLGSGRGSGIVNEKTEPATAQTRSKSNTSMSSYAERNARAPVEVKGMPKVTPESSSDLRGDHIGGLPNKTCETASSSSTLRGAAGTFASRMSITGSISSLLGRNQTGDVGHGQTDDVSSAASSVADRWRRLKQGVINTTGSTPSLQSGKETAASIFSAAAAKFMSSIVQNNFSRSAPSQNDIIESSTPEDRISSKESSALPKPSNTAAPSQPEQSDKESIVQSNTPKETSSSPKKDAPSSRLSNAPSATMISGSQRPSVISTTLSSHAKRAEAFNVMAKKQEPQQESPCSERSGEMTPPPAVDADMKRRSKEVDGELTSFLPAEMSRREEKFHEAARVNDATAIRTLLAERVNVNCRNSLDRTALHWAAANGNLAAVEALIEAKADLEAKDKYGMRALLWSAWFGHIPVLRALVNAGASTRVTNKQGLGILHCAAENNHTAVLAFIFESLEYNDVDQVDKNERTPLHTAADNGHTDAVVRLLQAKADLYKKDKVKTTVDGHSKGGMTAVHLASKQGHVDVLKALLLQGVEVDDRDVEGKTALHLAAEAGHKEVVDLLLDYTANPNSETVKEITPLHFAAQEGHTAVCKSLVKYGCNTNAQNFQGNTALHLAANGNHKEVARILVDARCELDLPNSRLQTALHVAVESGHLEVVQILLAGGASLEAREKSGKSALQLAARGNYVAVVDMLIKAERYYATARDYHDKDVGYLDPDSYLRKPQHPNAIQMKDVLWKLATKQLKPADWKKLAHHWQFTPEHVRAIEQEYTGPTSYREHSYRLLNIWLHGVRKDENVLKLLYESLVAIDKKQLAENIRRKVNVEDEKPCSPAMCRIS